MALWPESPGKSRHAPLRAGLAYHRLHLAGRPGAWRGLLGIALLVLGLIVVLPVAWLVPFAVGYAVAGRDVVEAMSSLLDLTSPTPAGLAYLNLVLASTIPLVWLLSWGLHGLRPGWLSSVRPRLRWGWFAVCLGLSAITLVTTVLLATLLPGTPAGASVTGEVNEFTSTTRDFLLVVLLLTPLQAAGEEYAFRGYLTQVFGRYGVVAAVVLPAVLFALAHGATQSVPVFVDRLAFGLVAGVLVVLTGGLEAGIAMHVLNNFVAFGLALSFGDMGSALNPTGGDWWGIPVTLTQSLLYLGLAVLVARRRGLATRSPAPVLAGPQRRV